MITISTHGLAAVARRFREMQLRVRDLSPAWEEVLTWWAMANKEQFASRGARWRSPWKPLAPSTVAQKRREGFLNESLVRTTDLRRELTNRPLGMERIRASDMEAGTDLSYAHFHQRGTRKMPRRVLINSEAVAREGVASSAIVTWVATGRPSTAGGLRLEG
jgi:hypothetical protein